MRKTPILIFFAILLFYLTPALSSAVLSEGDAIGSMGIMLGTMIFGLAIVLAGFYFMHTGKVNNIKFYSGFMLIGFGFMILLSTVTMALEINSNLGFTDLTHSIDRTWGLAMNLIRVLSYLTLIIMIILMINFFFGKKKEERESDGWDNNHY